MGHQPSLVPDKQVEQFPFGGRQFDLLPVHPDIVAGKIDRQSSAVKRLFFTAGDVYPVGPAQDRLYPGDKLDMAEGFGDVVVGSHLQPPGDVGILAPHRQHYDRHLRETPYLPQDIEAFHVRQADVQNYEVRVLRFYKVQSALLFPGNHRSLLLSIDTAIGREKENLQPCPSLLSSHSVPP